MLDSIILNSVVITSVANLHLVIPAYIDPNTGGMLFQILAVLFGVISGALLLFSGKIKGFYYRMRRKARGTEEEVSTEPLETQEDE
jgi:hypothetical protein